MAASVLVFVFGCLTLLLSLQLPIGTLHAPGSGFFPLLLGLILMALATCHILQLVFSEWMPTTEPQGKSGPHGSAQRVLLFMGIIALATAALDHLGFPLVAFLLMLALLKLLGVRRWRDSVLISFLTAAASYILFVRWLQIPMPKGWLGL